MEQPDSERPDKGGIKIAAMQIASFPIEALLKAPSD
jgi:hypothetical protein